jgi:hypothetical protein
LRKSLTEDLIDSELPPKPQHHCSVAAAYIHSVRPENLLLNRLRAQGVIGDEAHGVCLAAEGLTEVLVERLDIHLGIATCRRDEQNRGTGLAGQAHDLPIDLSSLDRVTGPAYLATADCDYSTHGYDLASNNTSEIMLIRRAGDVNVRGGGSALI